MLVGPYPHMSDDLDTRPLPELGYDRERDAYCVPYGDDPVTTALLAAARLTGTDPLELPPLSETVDPDDVERYVRYRDAGRVPSSTLSFSIDGVEISIAEGSILLRDESSAT